MKGELVTLIDHPTEPVTFNFHDDCRTGYAYLHSERKVVADVWLYNRSETPVVPDWDERGRMPMPYRNCARFAKPELVFALPESEDDINVRWIKDAAGRVGALVLFRNQVIGELFIGDMPGRSIMALKDGPVAHVMRIE